MKKRNPWAWLRLAIMVITIPLILTACNGCAGGGDAGETMKKYRADELVITRMGDCKPGKIIAKSRSGMVLDMCSAKAKHFVLLPPKTIRDGNLNVEQIPVEEFMDKVFMFVKGFTDSDKRNAILTKKNAKWHFTSAYWAANRQAEYFLKRYREHIRYPEPGTKAAEEEERMAAHLHELDLREQANQRE